MRSRLLTVLGFLLGVLVVLLLLVSIPIWLLLWVITGYNVFEVLSKRYNSKTHARIVELNKETERIKAETEELKRKIAEEESYKANIDRLKREN